MPDDQADVPADLPVDGAVGGVAEVVRRALISLAPTTGPARRGHRIVITRHNGPVSPTIRRAPHGTESPRFDEPGYETPNYGPPGLGKGPTPTPTAPNSGAPDNSPATTVPSGSSGAVRPSVAGSVPSSAAAPGSVGATADAESLGHGEAGVGLLVWDTTRTASGPLDEHDPGLPGGRPDCEVCSIDRLAAMLTPGGFLAVVTSSDRQGGRLRDPRPALIAAARAAGLDYWQHIVTTRPHLPHDDRQEDQHGNRHGDHVGSTRRTEWRLLAEVSVFCKPSPAGGVDRPDHAGHPAEPGSTHGCTHECTTTTEGQL